MKDFRSILAGAAFAVSMAPAHALLAQSPEAILSRAVSAYSGASSIAVRFNQTISNPLTGRTLETTGELSRQRPNLLSISFSGSDPDRIVADGSSLWVYLPSSAPGQVIRMPAKAAGGGMVIDPMGQLLSAPPGTYDVVGAGTASVGGHATHAITLTPRSRNSMFTSATVWVDDSNGLVRQLESREQSGLVRRIVVTSYRTNLVIPRSTFEFAPPPNVRVVDAGNMAAR